MDNFCGVVYEKIHVIDKPEEGGGIFGMNIIPLDADDSGPLLRLEHVQQVLPRFLHPPLIRERQGGVLLIRALAGYTIGGLWTGWKFVVGHPGVNDSGSGGRQ